MCVVVILFNRGEGVYIKQAAIECVRFNHVTHCIAFRCIRRFENEPTLWIQHNSGASFPHTDAIGFVDCVCMESSIRFIQLSYELPKKRNEQSYQFSRNYFYIGVH